MMEGDEQQAGAAAVILATGPASVVSVRGESRVIKSGI